MRTWAKSSPVTVGVALFVAGVIALFLAWNGAAGVDHVEGQVPYLVSGGLFGLALVGAGLTIVNLQARRQDSAELLAKLDDLAEAFQHAEVSGLPALTAVPSTGELVVAGRSTYHLASCRVVAGKSDLQAMAPVDAVSRGLTRCRICKPPAAAVTA